MKIGDIARTSEGRLFINQKILPRLASELKEGDNVLFVGTDCAWDYKTLFFNPAVLTNFETMDIKPDFKPDIVGDISNCPQIEDNKYDLVVLIGVYEFVNDKDSMFKEINRILKPEGKALLSLPGAGYYESPNNHVEPWQVWDKVKYLQILEMYVVGERNGKRPTSVHLIVKRVNRYIIYLSCYDYRFMGFMVW